MKKPSESSAKSTVATGMPDTLWAKNYPRLSEYLTATSWEDGSPREASALSVTVKDGYVSLALNDKELKQSLYTQAGSLAEALKLMEGALVAGVDAWRPWKAGKRK